MHCLHSCTRHAASLSVGIATTLLPPPAIVFTPAPVRTSNLDNKRREGVLVRGRRDGNSSHRKEQQRRRRQRIRMSEDNWWEEDGRLKEGVRETCNAVTPFKNVVIKPDTSHFTCKCNPLHPGCLPQIC
eukprot:1159063-Pelagomonas_calceolata.AAC.2